MIASNHSIAVRSLSRSTSSGRSSSRWAVRSSLRAKRGSSASSGAPSTSTSRRNWVSLPAVTIRSPSAHGSGSYGNRLGWLLPIRNGTTPPATYALDWLTMPDSADDIRLTSTCWPRPVSSRVVQGGEHADRRVQSGHHVEDRDAGAVGRPVGAAGQAHQPRDRLHDEVVAGQLRALLAAAEAADRRVDDRRGWRPRRCRSPGRSGAARRA